jgi:hypothetical protein
MKMTIYQVVFYNRFGERVADFGYYEDKLDAEKRAFEVRMKAAMESGKVCIEDVYVHDSSVPKSEKSDTNQKRDGSLRKEKCIDAYDLKDNEQS